MSDERIDHFRCFLKRTNPMASTAAISVACNAFIRKYGRFNVEPEIALGIAYPDELMRIRNAGVKSQAIYENARKVFRMEHPRISGDILALKKVFYEMADSEAPIFLYGIDAMVLQCCELGMNNVEKFGKRIAEVVTSMDHYIWFGDKEIIRRAFTKINEQMYPNVQNPQTYVVRLHDTIGEGYIETIFSGIDPTTIDEEGGLISVLRTRGYKVSISGRLYNTPIHIVNAKRMED